MFIFFAMCSKYENFSTKLEVFVTYVTYRDKLLCIINLKSDFKTLKLWNTKMLKVNHVKTCASDNMYLEGSKLKHKITDSISNKIVFIICHKGAALHLLCHKI